MCYDKIKINNYEKLKILIQFKAKNEEICCNIIYMQAITKNDDHVLSLSMRNWKRKEPNLYLNIRSYKGIRHDTDKNTENILEYDGSLGDTI